MSGSDIEDYVIVEKGDVKTGLEADIKPRHTNPVAASVPLAPGTPSPQNSRASPPTLEKVKAASANRSGMIEVISAHVLYWLLVGFEDSARYLKAIKQALQALFHRTIAAAPVARQMLAACRGAGLQYVTMIRTHDWGGLSQLAASHASLALSQLMYLGRAGAAAAQPIFLTILEAGQTVLALAIFIISNPCECWQRVAAVYERVKGALGEVYIRMDPDEKLLISFLTVLSSLHAFAIAQYVRADPQQKTARAFRVHVYPAMTKAATASAVAARKAQPHVVTAWKHTVPVVQHGWAEAKQAWNAPGVGWVFILAGMVGALGCTVALLGGV